MITTLFSAIALKATLSPQPAPMSDFEHGAEVRVMRTFEGKLYVGGRFERANRKLAKDCPFRIQVVGVSERRLPEPALEGLLEPAVQKAGLDLTRDDDLTVERER